MLTWLGVLLSLLFSALMVIAFQGDRPGEFATGLATVGGVLAALTGLALGLAQAHEGDERGWINREARNLFQATLYWFYAAFAQYIGSIQRLPVPFAYAAYTILSALVGLMVLVASFYTVFAVGWLLEFLNDAGEVARAEQTRSSRARNRFEKLLNR